LPILGKPAKAESREESIKKQKNGALEREKVAWFAYDIGAHRVYQAKKEGWRDADPGHCLPSEKKAADTKNPAP
jgi:hypothetical protein